MEFTKDQTISMLDALIRAQDACTDLVWMLRDGPLHTTLATAGRKLSEASEDVKAVALALKS